MCGIVGLFLKNPELEARLGGYLAPMLIGMSERGKRKEAYDLVAPLYAWFTEGLQSADLRAAATLLDQLARAA